MFSIQLFPAGCFQLTCNRLVIFCSTCIPERLCCSNQLIYAKYLASAATNNLACNYLHKPMRHYLPLSFCYSKFYNTSWNQAFKPVCFEPRRSVLCWIVCCLKIEDRRTNIFLGEYLKPGFAVCVFQSYCHWRRPLGLVGIMQRNSSLTSGSPPLRKC